MCGQELARRRRKSSVQQSASEEYFVRPFAERPKTKWYIVRWLALEQPNDLPYSKDWKQISILIAFYTADKIISCDQWESNKKCKLPARPMHAEFRFQIDNKREEWDLRQRIIELKARNRLKPHFTATKWMHHFGIIKSDKTAKKASTNCSSNWFALLAIRLSS